MLLAQLWLTTLKLFSVSCLLSWLWLTAVIWDNETCLLIGCLTISWPIRAFVTRDFWNWQHHERPQSWNGLIVNRSLEAVASTLYKLEVLLIFKKYLWKNQILFSTKLNQQLFDNWQLSRAVWAVFLAPIKQIQKFRKTCDLVTNIQNQNVKTEQICYKMSFVFKNTYAKINAGYCGDHVGPTTTRQISCFVVTFRFCWSIQKVSNYSY